MLPEWLIYSAQGILSFLREPRAGFLLSPIDASCPFVPGLSASVASHASSSSFSPTQASSLPPRPHTRHVCTPPHLSGTLYSRPMTINDNSSHEKLLEHYGSHWHTYCMPGAWAPVTSYSSLAGSYALPRLRPPARPSLGDRKGFLVGLLLLLFSIVPSQCTQRQSHTLCVQFKDQKKFAFHLHCVDVEKTQQRSCCSFDAASLALPCPLTPSEYPSLNLALPDKRLTAPRHPLTSCLPTASSATKDGHVFSLLTCLLSDYCPSVTWESLHGPTATQRENERGRQA